MVRSAKRCLKKSIGRNCLMYDELLTLVNEVESVLNSRPLSYVSSDDVVEPLTPSHLLVGFRLMSLPDPCIPEDPDYADSTEGVTRRMAHLTKSLQKFWRRWKRDYLMELRDFHRTRLEKGEAYTLERGEIVTVYDEGHPRGMWRLGRIEELIKGADEMVRGVHVRVVSKKGSVKILRRPIQHIYPLEIRSGAETAQSCHPRTEPDPEHGARGSEVSPSTTEGDAVASGSLSARPKRTAARNARELIRVLADEACV